MSKMTLRFRICNLLYRDYLRNYLAVDRIAIDNIIRMLEDGHCSEAKMNLCSRKLRRISDDMLWLMTGR